MTKLDTLTAAQDIVTIDRMHALMQGVTGYFSFDPAESLSWMEMPTFIFSKE